MVRGRQSQTGAMGGADWHLKTTTCSAHWSLMDLFSGDKCLEKRPRDATQPAVKAVVLITASHRAWCH